MASPAISTLSYTSIHRLHTYLYIQVIVYSIKGLTGFSDQIVKEYTEAVPII